MNEPIGIAAVLAEITRRFEAAAPKIRTRSKLGIKGKDLAKQFGVSERAISFVINRKSYRHVISGGVETERCAKGHAGVDCPDGERPLSSRGSSAPPTENLLPSPSDQSKDSSAVPVDLNVEAQNEGPEPEELDSFYDRLDTGGLELQAPTFDPDLYD